MTAYISTKTGNWSDSTVWSPAGVPASGDSVSIGAHTITIDVATVIGTSANNATTNAINITSGSGKLIVAAGKTLTCKGMINGAFITSLQMGVGSGITFDNSASGGSPIYGFLGFWNATIAGSAASPAVLQAIAGQTFAFCPFWGDMAVSNCSIVRCAAPGSANAGFGASVSITATTYTSCAVLDLTINSASIGFTFADVKFVSSTDATSCVKLQMGTAPNAGVTRLMARVVLDKSLNNLAKGLTLVDFVIGGITCYAGTTTFAAKPRNGFLRNDLNLNNGNGMLTVGSWERCYFVVNNANGNPHFLAPTATAGADETYSQCIFEAITPDAIDLGDCFIVQGTNVSGGKKIVAKNCIVLPNSQAGTAVSSGTLLTGFSITAAPIFESYRSTCNVEGGGLSRGVMIAPSEGGAGAAGQVTAVKSNIAWARTSGSFNFVGERVSGTLKDVVTPAGVDFNWVWNTAAGDNGRGWRDKDNSPAQTLWTAGNAAAAGVDVHQGTGDPQYLDSTRNIATWCAARGLGAATYAAGRAALEADPTRVADLIAYVFEGHKPRNAAMRSAAHDGGVAGAANWHKSTRKLGAFTTFRASAGTRYGVAL